MGYQENLELYLKFSRKELQALCKKHHLPANKSHSYLAKSLASYSKKRKSTSAAAKEKPVNSVGFSLDTSYIPVLKTKETVQPLKETTAGAYENFHFPENDSNGLTNGISMKIDDGRAQLQIGNKMGSSSQMVKGTPEKPFDSAAHVVFPFRINMETEEGFGSSTTRPGMVGNIRSLSSADIQSNPAARRQGFEYHDGTIHNGFGKHLEPSSSGQNPLNHSVSISGTRHMAPMQYRHRKVGEHFTESGVSSDEITERATPSLQFFVMSEEGINLYVDLNSTPSAWINSLKDEVCIHPRSQHSAQGSPSNFVNTFDNHRAISPSGCPVVEDLENKVAERTSLCTNSSLSSAISENCQSKAYPRDATAVTSGSSVLTSTSAPVETVGYQEGSVVSSSYLTSGVQKHRTSDIAFCPSEKVLPQDSVNDSFRNQSRVYIPDSHPNPTGNIDMHSSDGTKKYKEVECSTVNNSITGFTGAAACYLGNTVKRNSEKISSQMSNDIQENIECSDNSILKGHKGVCDVSIEIGLIEGSAEDPGYVDRLSNCCQLARQRSLEVPMTDAQSDAGSEDHLSLGNSVPEDSMPTFNTLGKITLVMNTDSSESSQFLDKHSKGSNDSGDFEEFQSKRQHAGQSKKEAVTNLRSAKTSAIETQYDPIVLLRRSSRKSKIE